MLLRVDAEIGTSFGKLLWNIHKNIGIQNIIDKEGFCQGSGVCTSYRNEINYIQER